MNQQRAYILGIVLLTSLINFFIYKGYLYLQKLKELKKERSELFRDILKNYIKSGYLSVVEFEALLLIVKNMGNRLGIFKQHVDKSMAILNEYGDVMKPVDEIINADAREIKEQEFRDLEIENENLKRLLYGNTKNKVEIIKDGEEPF
ncbi:hypothetical protein [Candidatus Phytoplasma fraxini]|uniref:Uncharacterized protein n=1 Tax=Ash yellows phytoplasma TaxID=35780 RepID=A0ABZ2U7T6_ASHYP